LHSPTFSVAVEYLFKLIFVKPQLRTALQSKTGFENRKVKEMKMLVKTLGKYSFFIAAI